MTPAIKLSQLAIKYQSDKAELGYMPLYAEYFEKMGLMPENVRNVLEIGTNKGSSLRVWAEFFPNANIWGLDITRRYEIKEIMDHPNIKTFLVNQGSSSELEAFITYDVKDTKFDIIVDDGSHDQYDQQLSLSKLFDLLRPGGLYVIEDLITGENWWDGNLYNKRQIVPTRDILKEFELIGKLPEDFTNRHFIEEHTAFCHYRESLPVIYDQHHPQIAFIGRAIWQ